MGENSEIQWTDHTFNPWIGCQKVSPGCDHCYAEALMDHRYGKVKWGPHGERVRTSEDNWKKPLKWARAALKAGVRHKVFCASLADWLDNKVPEKWRIDLGLLIEATPELDWLLLTKRIENFENLSPWLGRPSLPKNVWIGVTVEDQAAADRRIPELLCVPTNRRFLSCEPLLGPLEIENYLRCEHFGVEALMCDCPRVDWVIVGGESGVGARPMHPQWARDIRDQCNNTGAAFFFKQNGEYVSVSEVEGPGDHFKFPDGATVRKTGKKLAGRTLDGREWNEIPESV